MQKEKIYFILGIEETKEESVIRDAYLTKLKNTNPEDDPEGFKKLREAYDEAIKLCRVSDNEEKDQEPDDEISLWLKEANEIYDDLYRRIEITEWEKLLSNPICDDLDSSFDARERFIGFLYEKSKLPQNVWQLIDKTFEIVKDKEELKDRFDENFLEYVKYNVENATFLVFELFDDRGLDHDGSNADNYINAFFELKKAIDDGEYEKAKDLLEEMDAFALYHPYEKVEKMKLLCETDSLEDAFALANEVLNTLGDRIYPKYNVAHVFMVYEKIDEAQKLLEEIIEEVPDYYNALNDLAICYKSKHDYKNAKEKYIDMLDIVRRNDELENKLKEVNSILINQYQEKVDNNDYNSDDISEYAWCLFQNQDYSKALDIMELYDKDNNDYYDYINIHSRLLFALERYKEALPEIFKWYKIIEATEDDGTKKAKRRINRKNASLYYLGIIFAKTDDIKNAKKYFDMCLDCTSDNNDYIYNLHGIAVTYLECKEYDLTIETCDRLIAKSKQYYPAYLIRQEAAYELRKAQQVIDDYYDAVEIFPGYFKPYMMAADVFINYSRYEDAKQIIDRAKKNEVVFSSRFKLVEYRTLRALAQDNETRSKIIGDLLSLKNELNTEECDIEDPSEIDYEIALLYWDCNNYEKGLDAINDAINIDDKNDKYYYIKADLLLDIGKHEEAIKFYNQALKSYSDDIRLIYNRAQCYEKISEVKGYEDEYIKKALSDYTFVSLKEPTYRATLIKMSELNERKYHRTSNMNYLKQAIGALESHLDITETKRSYRDLGYLYFNINEFDKAIYYFSEYIKEFEPQWDCYYRLGWCYENTRRFKEAIDLFEKALAIEDERNSYVLERIINVYYIQSNYDKALEYCDKLSQFKHKHSIDVNEKRFKIYMEMKKYSEARKIIKNMSKSNKYDHLAKIYMAKCDVIKANYLLKKNIDKAHELNNEDVYFEIAQNYLFAGKYKKAIKYFTKCVALYKKFPKYITVGYKYYANIARAFYMDGQLKAAKTFGEKALDAYKESHEASLEDFLAYKPSRATRLGIFGWIYICIGETQKGLSCFKNMRDCSLCNTCVNNECHESYLYEALYLEALDKKDTERIKDLYKKVLVINPGDEEALFACRRLKITID